MRRVPRPRLVRVGLGVVSGVLDAGWIVHANPVIRKLVKHPKDWPAEQLVGLHER
jgi:hypothetical protein